MRHFLLVALVLIVCTSVGYAIIAAVSVAAQALYTGEPIVASVRSLAGPPGEPNSAPHAVASHADRREFRAHYPATTHHGGADSVSSESIAGDVAANG
jgi:hypothetical protein